MKRSTVENYLERIITSPQRWIMKETKIGIADDEWIEKKEASRRISARLAELQKNEAKEYARVQKLLNNWKYEPPGE